jgi:hypothetical protein
MHVISSCAELLYDPVYTCWPNNWARQAIFLFIIDTNQFKYWIEGVVLSVTMFVDSSFENCNWTLTDLIHIELSEENLKEA